MSIVTHFVTGARLNSGTKQHSGGVRREKVCESVDLISASSPSTYCMHRLEWAIKINGKNQETTIKLDRFTADGALSHTDLKKT